MSLKSALYVACLSLAIANVHSYCCTSHKFQATLQLTGAIINSLTNSMVTINGYSELYYDYDGRRLRLDSHTLQQDGSYRNSTTISLYSANMQYITEGGHQCTEFHLNATMREPCVPAYATLVANSTLGSGQHIVGVQFYMFNDVDDGLQNKLVVTSDDCTPVELTVQGVIDGVDQIYTYTFTQVTHRIRDNTVFDVHKPCVTSHGPPIVG